MISTDELGDRDDWVCGLCGAPIDRDLKWPDIKSKSIDHIIPKSKLGVHEESNVQIAHLGCNISKGNRMEEVNV